MENCHDSKRPVAVMLLSGIGFSVGCVSAGREVGTVYRTPWSTTFVVEPRKDGLSEVLRVRGTRLSVAEGPVGTAADLGAMTLERRQGGQRGEGNQGPLSGRLC